MNYYLETVFNTTFWNFNYEKQISSVQKAILSNFFNLAYPETPFDDFHIEYLKVSLNPFADCNSLNDMKTSFKKRALSYNTQIILFLSIYDIHPKIKKATKYIIELQKLGYDVFIYSLNPAKPFSEYCEDFLSYNAIYDLYNKRYRSEKYHIYLLRFAAHLRTTSPPVKFKVITKYTGIPKTTLISFMQRENIESVHAWGRDELTEDEKYELQLYRHSGVSLY